MEQNYGILNAKNITIGEYLVFTDKIIIPRYQRPYSWEKKNVEMLLNDVKSNYYIGNIIEYCADNEKEIVDGQQRLITIFLTLIAIYHTIENEMIKEKIKKMILKNGECKMQLKSRIANDGSDILEYLINGSSIPREIEKRFNEINIYKVICKIINRDNAEEIFNNINGSNIVEITFLHSEYSAHEMFVNVNTKGKPLNMIEILKSQLFKYLLDCGASDAYKEKWEIMLKNIPQNEYDAYCSDCYLLDYFKSNVGAKKYKTNGIINENCLKLIDSITGQERAEKIFNFMTGSELDNVYEVYNSIKNHKLNSLKDNYYSNSVANISFGEIDELWNLYGEFGFKQSDIFFTTIFYNKQNLIVNHLGFVNLVMKYIFMYELYRSVSRNSPASYSNIFKQAAARIINSANTNEIKDIIKEFVESLEIKEEQYEVFKERLTKLNTFDSSKYKTGKFVVLMSENFYTKGLSVEHFISQNTKKETDKRYVGALGNLIPVIKDRYRNNDVSTKLKLYECDRTSDKGIKNFLEYGFNEENYKEIIELRGNEIAENFIKQMKDYYIRIMKG